MTDKEKLIEAHLECARLDLVDFIATVEKAGKAIREVSAQLECARLDQAAGESGDG